MAKAVRYHKQGGPEVLQVDDVTVGDPGPGQVRVRHTAIGVNFVDTYQRSGLYPMQLQAVAGNEAAGGVGLIAGQWLKKLGANTIGTVGSEEKAKLAKAHGYKHVINYSTENWVEKVKEITKGKKLPVIYDAVGKTTWDGSLDSLQPRGLLVSFGNASGPVPPQNLGILASKGSLYVTRPTLATYIAARADLVKRSNDLFNAVKSKKVKIETTARYKLADAAQAHRDLEGRKTTGSVVLIP
jgi:NADPH2:quinone reductase